LARDNYSYQKFKREQAKKKKKEEKMQRKLDKKNAVNKDNTEQAPGEEVAQNPQINPSANVEGPAEG
jgi:hypothetical protein